MKKNSFLLTMIMCLVSVSLLANPIYGDDSKIVKVFTLEEINNVNAYDTEFSEILSMRLIQNENEFHLEISGVDLKGETVAIVKSNGFELYPCGTCIMSQRAPSGLVEGMLLVFPNGDTTCFECEVQSAPGPQ